MKKVFLFFLLILLSFSLSGCLNGTSNVLTENEVNNSMSNFNGNEILNEINEVSRGDASQAPANESDEAGQESSEEEGVQLENLTMEFSQAIIKTSLGDIKVQFYPEDSPLTVNSFMNLAKKGFYDGTRFHRVIKDFMIQGGDPLSKDASMKERWGTGGPEYRFQDEINDYKLVKGSLAMANSGPNTNGSQFFIVTAEATSWLDGKHTNFGEVIEGLDIVEKIGVVEVDGNDRPLEDIIVEKVELLP